MIEARMRVARLRSLAAAQRVVRAAAWHGPLMTAEEPRFDARGPPGVFHTRCDMSAAAPCWTAEVTWLGACMVDGMDQQEIADGGNPAIRHERDSYLGGRPNARARSTGQSALDCLATTQRYWPRSYD